MVKRAVRQGGFTLIELLVVMAILATLLSLVAPRYFDSVERGKEAALRTNLRMLREAIDKHRADTGRLPESLEQLVESRYLRAVPLDPVTDRMDWILVPMPGGAMAGVYDVHSGASGMGRDSTAYSTW